MPQDSVAEKRQKLLGALQRCDEDLNVLKKITEVVRFTDRMSQSSSPAVVSIGLEDKLRTVTEVCWCEVEWKVWGCPFFNGGSTSCVLFFPVGGYLSLCGYRYELVLV